MEKYYQFEPKFNDFGDNYHKPDELVYANIDTAVKEIKRKYRKYSDYARAIETISSYMENLVETYGGMDNFKMAIMLKNVTEYIPPIPKFRNTSENKLLHKYGSILSEQVEEVDYEIDPEMEYEIEFGYDIGFDYKYVNDVPFELTGSEKRTMSFSTDGGASDIARDLDLLATYESEVRSKDKKKGKKYKRKNHLNVIKNFRKNAKKSHFYEKPTGMLEIFEEHNNDVSGITDHLDNKITGRVMYKGVAIERSEIEALEVNKLLESAGIIDKIDTSMFKSKKLRKMIKNEEKDAKKGSKKKKKNKKVAVDDISDFVDDYIDAGTPQSFRAFQKEMEIFSSAQMNNNLGDEW